VVLAAFDEPDARHEACLMLIADPARRLSTIDLSRLEVANVAVTRWRRSLEEVAPMLEVLEEIADDGGMVPMNTPLTTMAAQVAKTEGISVYDASYVIGARKMGCVLVSCDERDLVSKGLAVSPAEAVASLSRT
jgi:predicted nucleic acid-binding protein